MAAGPETAGYRYIFHLAGPEPGVWKRKFYAPGTCRKVNYINTYFWVLINFTTKLKAELNNETELTVQITAFTPYLNVQPNETNNLDMPESSYRFVFVGYYLL